MSIEYVDVDLEPKQAPAPTKQNPELVRVQTRGKIYDLSKRSAAEIEAEKARWAADALAKKSGAASEVAEQPVDPRQPSDIRRLLDESRTAPENLIGVNVKVFGIDLPALHYGTVSAKVDGIAVQLPGGPAVTVNAKGEITSVKFRGGQVTKDGRGIAKMEFWGVNVTAAVQLGKAFKMGAGAIVREVVDGPVGRAGEKMRTGWQPKDGG